MFKPAFRHIFSTLAVQLNQIELLDYYEFFYFLISSSMDAIHLFSDKASSFIESLNGLRRVPISLTPKSFNPSARKTSNPTELFLYQRTISLAYVMVVPRLIEAIRSMRDQLHHLEENHRYQRSYYLFFKYMLIKGITMLSEYGLAIEQIGLVMTRILYVFQKIPFHHPLFFLLQMKLVKAKHLDQSQSSSLSQRSRPILQSPSSPSNTQSNRNWQMSLILGIILTIRAAEWYLNNDFTSEHLTTRLTKKIEIPPYPKPMAVASTSNAVIPPADRRLCALCCQRRKNPCASSSGYVFCYNCILPYVRERKVCPITQLPCNEQDLIKLFES